MHTPGGNDPQVSRDVNSAQKGALLCSAGLRAVFFLFPSNRKASPAGPYVTADSPFHQQTMAPHWPGSAARGRAPSAVISAQNIRLQLRFSSCDSLFPPPPPSAEEWGRGVTWLRGPNKGCGRGVSIWDPTPLSSPIDPRISWQGSGSVPAMWDMGIKYIASVRGAQRGRPTWQPHPCHKCPKDGWDGRSSVGSCMQGRWGTTEELRAAAAAPWAAPGGAELRAARCLMSDTQTEPFGGAQITAGRTEEEKKDEGE